MPKFTLTEVAPEAQAEKWEALLGIWQKQTLLLPGEEQCEPRLPDTPRSSSKKDRPTVKPPTQVTVGDGQPDPSIKLLSLDSSGTRHIRNTYKEIFKRIAKSL